MPISKQAVELPNIHPADELAAIREEIKIMESRADELKAILSKPDANRVGDQYTAVIKANTRKSLDQKAITEAFGEAAVAPFVRSTNYNTVLVVEN